MEYAQKFKEFFDIKFPRVRASDPITSFEAADSIKEIASKQFVIIMDCLIKHGPMGKDSIANHTNLDSAQISRRLGEMQKLGAIKLTGKTVKSNSGRNEREWTV